MYLVSEGTATWTGIPKQHNTLSQAKKAVVLLMRQHEQFCRKHDKDTLTVLYQAIGGVDLVTDKALLDVTARAWVINIGGISRHFRLEVIHG